MDGHGSGGRNLTNWRLLRRTIRPEYPIIPLVTRNTDTTGLLAVLVADAGHVGNSATAA